MKDSRARDRLIEQNGLPTSKREWKMYIRVLLELSHYLSRHELGAIVLAYYRSEYGDFLVLEPSDFPEAYSFRVPGPHGPPIVILQRIDFSPVQFVVQQQGTPDQMFEIRHRINSSPRTTIVRLGDCYHRIDFEARSHEVKPLSVNGSLSIRVSRGYQEAKEVFGSQWPKELCHSQIIELRSPLRNAPC